MKLTLQLSIISVLNLVALFLFQWYVIFQLGPGLDTDALFAGMTVPQLVLTIVSGSLMHVLVPLLAGEDLHQLRRDAWGFFYLIGAFFLLLSIVLIVLAPWWVPLTVPGFDQAGKALAIDLTRIQLIGIAFSAISGVQLASCHVQGQFIWADLATLLSNLVVFILLVYLLPEYGISAAAWLGSFRVILQALFLSPSLGLPLCPELKSEFMRKAWSRLKPLMWGSLYYKTEILVDRFLLSMATAGSISLYFLAQQIYQAVNLILNKAIAAPLVPRLSRHYKGSERNNFEASFCRAYLLSGMIVAIFLALLYLYGLDLLALLVGNGSVSEENVKDLWWILIWLSGMLVGGALGQITSSGFYATGDTSTITRIGVYTYTIYIPVKIGLFFLEGIQGLAIATSLFFVVNTILQLYYLKRRK